MPDFDFGLPSQLQLDFVPPRPMPPRLTRFGVQAFRRQFLFLVPEANYLNFDLKVPAVASR